MRFRLTPEPLVSSPLMDHGAGGFVTFEGKVRNHANGRAVTGLEYEAFPEMAIAQGDALLAEAIERFELTDAAVVHRTGALSLGETAVIVQTAAPHRREAFAACEWIMDQLKWRVPIWKRETYSDGVSEWVHAGSPPTIEETRFDRQIRLPEVGHEGQARLVEARVLLVGVGGLAAGAIPPLVGAGIGTLGLVDSDTVEETNLHRQTLFTPGDVGRAKVDRAAAFCRRLWPGIHVEVFPVRLDASNVDALVQSYDWVVDGTDSLTTKFLLNAACQRHGKPFVTASVHRFEGQILTVFPGGPCLQCLFPEPPGDGCVGVCADEGVLGVLPFTLGALEANEVIKGILGLSGATDELVLVDLLSLETTRLKRAKRDGCPGCDGIWAEPRLEWEVDAIPAGYDLVDIREPNETPGITIPHQKVVMAECYSRTWTRPTVFVCARGARSARLVADLRAQGCANVYSLAGGIEALRCRS